MMKDLEQKASFESEKEEIVLKNEINYHQEKGYHLLLIPGCLFYNFLI